MFSAVVADGTLIAKCGQNLDYLGIVDLEISVSADDSSGARTAKVNHSFQLICSESLSLTGDEKVLAVVEEFERRQREAEVTMEDEVLTVVQPQEHTDGGDNYSSGDNLGYSLSTQSSDMRTSEAAFPCYVADAMKWKFQQLGVDCDFAIINGGFVRGDRLYPPGAPIMMSHILQEMPFPRCPVLLRLSGAVVKLGLEQMLAGAHAPVGSFPHLSNGLKVSYDLKADPLDRVKAIHTTSPSGDEVPLESSKEYLVAVSDFYYEKEGDGVNAFFKKTVAATCSDQTGAVTSQYLRDVLEVVNGTPPGRLVHMRREV